jgi:hypothetical protein
MKKLVTSFIGATLLLCCAANAFAADKYPPGPAYRACPDTLTIVDIQQADTTLAPCHPALLDTVVSVQGIIIGFDQKPTGFSFNMETTGGGPYSGVNVFTGSFNWAGAPFNLALGDKVRVTGRTQEFPAAAGMTELEGPDGIQGTNDIIIGKISSGNPLPPIQIVTTTQLNWVPAAAGAEGEKWDGTLVRVRGPHHECRRALHQHVPVRQEHRAAVRQHHDRRQHHGDVRAACARHHHRLAAGHREPGYDQRYQLVPHPDS